WKSNPYAISALGSPDHLIRQKAMDELVKREVAGARLIDYAAATNEPIGAANALWVMHRLDVLDDVFANERLIADWRVRRLAGRLSRQMAHDRLRIGSFLSLDPDPAVRLEVALSKPVAAKTRDALVNTLTKGAASDVHLRYEAAWHLAKHAD